MYPQPRDSAHALALDGLHATASAVPAGTVSAELIASLGGDAAQVFVLSYFSQQPQQHAQNFCRRLKRRWPAAKVVLALWNVSAEDIAALPLIEWGVDAAVNSIAVLTSQVAMRRIIPAIDGKRHASARPRGMDAQVFRFAPSPNGRLHLGHA